MRTISLLVVASIVTAACLADASVRLPVLTEWCPSMDRA
jgi:hypothetical protein